MNPSKMLAGGDSRQNCLSRLKTCFLASRNGSGSHIGVSVVRTAERLKTVEFMGGSAISRRELTCAVTICIGCSDFLFHAPDALEVEARSGMRLCDCWEPVRVRRESAELRLCPSDAVVSLPATALVNDGFTCQALGKCRRRGSRPPSRSRRSLRRALSSVSLAGLIAWNLSKPMPAFGKCCALPGRLPFAAFPPEGSRARVSAISRRGYIRPSQTNARNLP